MRFSADSGKTTLAFRIDPDLKQQIEEIADEEQRSISQICELFLKGAVEDYKKKDGPQYIQRLLAPGKNTKRLSNVGFLGGAGDCNRSMPQHFSGNFLVPSERESRRG